MVKTLGLYVLFACGLLSAQQQVTPAEFDSRQARLFEKITVSVSAPCCNNGIPVAYHDSGMAQQVRDMITKSIAAGKTEKQIFAELAEVRMGSSQQHLIFTIPESNALGWLAWGSPLIAILIGAGFIAYFIKRKKTVTTEKLSDDQLIEKYRAQILKQIENP